MRTAPQKAIQKQPLLLQLELLNKEKEGLKERVFEWIADLSQDEFNQLCNEIVSLDQFFKKYEGVMVTDNEHLIRPFKDILPRVEFVVKITAGRFDKVFLYRWLEDISTPALQSICWELEDCCDQAMELVDTYIVSAIKSTLTSACWQIDSSFTGNLSLIASVVKNWVNKSEWVSVN